MPRWEYAHVQDDSNPHLLRMFEDIFLLDTAHMAVHAHYEQN